MALHSLYWERGWRVPKGEPCPIGWQLLDSAGKRVGQIIDVLADDRSRRAVYAVAALDGAAPVLVDVDRLTLDVAKRQLKASLNQAALTVLSPATWWRRPAVVRRPAAARITPPPVVPVYEAPIAGETMAPPAIVSEGPAGPVILPEVERQPAVTGRERQGPGEGRRAA